MVGCGHSLECRGGRVGVSEGVDNAPRAESSRHDGTTLVPSGGTEDHGRYDCTTPVPSGGATVPPLYPEVVRL